MKQTCILLLCCFVITNCGSTKQLTPSKYNPSFDYTPEQRSPISDKSLTVAIINPVFSDGEDNTLVEPYLSFVNNMADDVEEVLNAKGFKIKGPYNTRDEMVYGDKLNSDFAIEVEVEILNEQGDLGKRSLPLTESILYGDAYRLGGTFYHKGRIIMTATDPIDGEKFWKKSIDLERRPVTAEGTMKFTGYISEIDRRVLMEDVAFYNAAAKVLEAYYSETLSSLSRQIDPREMEHVSKQIKEKRKRVGQ